MLRLIFLLLGLMLSSVGLAADPEYNFYRDQGAVHGYDVVEYFNLPAGAEPIKGDRQIYHDWKGVKWYFSKEENKAKFAEAPEKYAPQFGGYCAFAVSKNFTTSIRPDKWLIVDGKLYLNHNKASMRIFQRNLEKSISKANKNWPEVLKRCEKRGRCRELPKGESKN